jgi:hypothetical protein
VLVPNGSWGFAPATYEEVFPSSTSPTRRLAGGRAVMPLWGRSLWSLKPPAQSEVQTVKAAAAYAVRSRAALTEVADACIAVLAQQKRR